VEEKTDTTTTEVATHASAAAGATWALSCPAPAPPPSSSTQLLRALRKLERPLLLLLVTVVRRRHHDTGARVMSKGATTQIMSPTRMRVRYRDPTRITVTRVGSLRTLVVPPTSLALRMSASIAADKRRL
jgi:hypothetical protein